MVASEIVTRIFNLAVVVSLPTVGLGLLIGLIISIIQAVTQIQEQTLTFVPKMVVVLLLFAVFFHWMFGLISGVALDLWQDIPIYSQ
ncbi:flagellar biosynthetic protein FliQ [Candidatus Marinamargulisbacteria bacterium]|jgi:flagellar biosynthetic protein FliQ|nr:flagellar biosynthetic protein FliQ [Candidatus Marinamargulisbacteria bacterium]